MADLILTYDDALAASGTALTTGMKRQSGLRQSWRGASTTHSLARALTDAWVMCEFPEQNVGRASFCRSGTTGIRQHRGRDERLSITQWGGGADELLDHPLRRRAPLEHRANPVRLMGYRQRIPDRPSARLQVGHELAVVGR